MPSRNILFYAFASCCLLKCACLPAQEPLPPSVHVSVNEVSIGVTVTTKSGTSIHSLKQSDFRVFDNGAPSPILGFLSDDDPGYVAILLETGPGAFFNKPTEVRTALRFLDALPADYQVALVDYSRSAELLLDFTANKSATRQTLSSLNFMSGFGQLNLISSLLATMDWLASLPGKKTIILLSTGIDTSPDVNWSEVHKRLQSSSVRVFAVSLSEEMRTVPKNQVLSPQQRDDLKYVQSNFANADRLLRAITEPTGGHVYFPKRDKDFEHAFGNISEFVSHEYRLSIAPTPPDGQVHTLNVNVKRSFAKLSFRQGYLTAPSQPTPPKATQNGTTN